MGIRKSQETSRCVDAYISGHLHVTLRYLRIIHVVTLLFMSRTLEHDKSAMMSQILANVDVLFYDTE